MNNSPQIASADTVLSVQGVNNEPVFVIQADGNVIWRGNSVESDEQFRAAMMDLATAMRSMSDPRFPPEYVALRNQNHAMQIAIARLQEERIRLLERIEALTNAPAT